ncbi:uncharacterized protein LOC128679816 [Plodia interpunctella]|uniref:uncharacterized protein LOC128679816 n=1 Tax=Plodia interpunctella TaxID=58824 RepID=UPI002367C45B|nr:uncharacterized protein LOC128679816 [Plodia interpunctella]
MIVTIFLSFLVIYVNGVDCVLSVGETSKLCVPTENIDGPRHSCICGTDGVYHCVRRVDYLEDRSEINMLFQQRQCEPNYTYQEQNLICTCNEFGDWRSKNCYQNFHIIRARDMLSTPALRTKEFSCMPNKMYLVDCNMCICDESGYIDPSRCTTRTCTKGHKIDRCVFGDILRTTDELCSCSDINVYIDRLCVSISEHRIQKIKNELFDVLIQHDTRLRTIPVFSDRCSQADLAEVDCNTCYCIAGNWACTNKKCEITKKVEKLRNRKKAFLSLPEVFSDKETCVPFRKYRYRCNTCICSKKKVLSCTSMICLEALLSTSDSDATRNIHTPNANGNIPEIRDGEECEEGKLYRKECNICRCTMKKDLKCTKKMCFKGKDRNKLKKSKGDQLEKVPYHKKQLDLPELPTGACGVGKFYKKGCRKCYCEHDRKAVCADGPVGPNCKLEIKSYRDSTPDDYGVKTDKIDITKLLELPNLSTKCDPGHTYKVDCNTCICLANKNLLCTHNFCLSIDDMNKVEARKRSGLPCSKDVKEDPCMICRCVDDKLTCEAVKKCQEQSRKRLHGALDSSRAPLSLTKGQDCIPGTVYKDRCNRCYCQEDRALRCTAMTCLNYMQALSLQKPNSD